MDKTSLKRAYRVLLGIGGAWNAPGKLINEVIDNGCKWYIEHKELVDNMMEVEKPAYVVYINNEDIDSPEIWKGIEWNWFFRELGKKAAVEIERDQRYSEIIKKGDD